MASISPPASQRSKPATEYYPPLPTTKRCCSQRDHFRAEPEKSNSLPPRSRYWARIAFRNDHELRVPANFCDFLTIKHVNVHAHTESRPVEYWRVHHSQHRKRCLLSYTSPYFRPNSLDDAS